MSLLRRLIAHLTEQAPHEPPADEIVFLVQLRDSYQAEALRQLLENSGISAVVYPDPFLITGIFGSTGTGGGTRVMVQYKDMAAAQEVTKDFLQDY